MPKGRITLALSAALVLTLISGTEARAPSTYAPIAESELIPIPVPRFTPTVKPIYDSISRPNHEKPVVSQPNPSPKTIKPVAIKPKPLTIKVPVSNWNFSKASSYGIGDGFLGGHLACGGRLDNDTLVVAHKTLPCGTKVQICFTRSSGTFCTDDLYPAAVRDRGPYCCGRELDLGPAVARKVHFAGIGVVKWRIVK